MTVESPCRHCTRPNMNPPKMSDVRWHIQTPAIQSTLLKISMESEGRLFKEDSNL